MLGKAVACKLVLDLQGENTLTTHRYPGPPITKESVITRLMSHNVTVGIGCEEIWSARNLPFDAAWVSGDVLYLA